MLKLYKLDKTYFLFTGGVLTHFFSVPSDDII